MASNMHLYSSKTNCSLLLWKTFILSNPISSFRPQIKSHISKKFSLTISASVHFSGVPRRKWQKSCQKCKMLSLCVFSVLSFRVYICSVSLSSISELLKINTPITLHCPVLLLPLYISSQRFYNAREGKGHVSSCFSITPNTYWIIFAWFT